MPLLLKSILAIALGSTVGGLLRWFLSLKFNSMFTLPLGTLLSNLIAGYIIGVAIGYFSNTPQLSPEWRLFIITGFCGGLSTFSTFSAEIIQFFQKGELFWGLSTIAIHVIGSLLMTAIGLASYQWLRGLIG